MRVVCAAPLSEIIENKDASGQVAKWAIQLSPYTPRPPPSTEGMKETSHSGTRSTTMSCRRLWNLHRHTPVAHSLASDPPQGQGQLNPKSVLCPNHAYLQCPQHPFPGTQKKQHLFSPWMSSGLPLPSLALTLLGFHWYPLACTCDPRLPSGCVLLTQRCSCYLLTQLYFHIPGVSLKHSASNGHSHLECLLLSAVLEARQDCSQSSCAELGGPRAHSYTHLLHELSI
jgi:hypothetical protein